MCPGQVQLSLLRCCQGDTSSFSRICLSGNFFSSQLIISPKKKTGKKGGLRHYFEAYWYWSENTYSTATGLLHQDTCDHAKSVPIGERQYTSMLAAERIPLCPAQVTCIARCSTKLLANTCIYATLMEAWQLSQLPAELTPRTHVEQMCLAGFTPKYDE